jgi:hypothetical protein
MPVQRKYDDETRARAVHFELCQGFRTVSRLIPWVDQAAWAAVR